MGITQVIQLVLSILSKVGTILGIVTNVQSLLGLQQTALDTTAKEDVPMVIEVNVKANHVLLVDPVIGLAAITTQLSEILSAISDLTPVTLPPTPPPGYQAPDAATIALAVWDTPLPVTDQSTLDALQTAETFAANVGTQMGIINGTDPKFVTLGAGWHNFLNAPQPANNDTANINNVLPTDDRVTFLNRETGETDWHLDPLTGFPTFDTGSQTNYPLVWPISEAEFDLIKFGYPPHAAPVWPGIAGVTLGTPLTLDDGITVPGPLDGVIVAITSVPVPISFYPFGTLKSYVRAGAIAFVDDNGDAEFPQPFGPENLVIVPKSMQQADHALVRLPSGVIGTVTPWLAV